MRDKIKTACAWLVTHRRKIASVAVVALPLVARFVPGFPVADVLSVVRAYLGA